MKRPRRVTIVIGMVLTAVFSLFFLSVRKIEMTVVRPRVADGISENSSSKSAFTTPDRHVVLNLVSEDDRLLSTEKAITDSAAAHASSNAAPNATFSQDQDPEKPYVKRIRPAQLSTSSLPDRTTSPGRQDRLPLFHDVTPTVRWERMADHGSRNYAWYGKVADDRLSLVILTRVGDYTILDVQSPKLGRYEVHGQDGKLAEVRELDAARIDKGCKTSVLTAGFGSNPTEEVSFEIADSTGAITPASIAAFSASTIDVLLVYSTKAMNNAGGRSAIVARAQSGVNGLNGAFGHSLIVHEARLVQTRETSHSGSGSLGTDLGWIAGDSTTASIRSEVSADLVGFISDKDTGGIGGIAQLPGAFTAVFADLFGGVWPHEAGHNFGCQHNSPGVYSYASGHYWTDQSDGVQRGSIMSYIGSRIPYFSNPDKEFSGEPTGTASRNNALCVNNRGPTTAAFKSGAKTIVEPSCVVTSSTTKPILGVDFTVSIKTVNGGPSTMSAGQIGITLPSKVTLMSHSGGGAFNTTTKVWSVPSIADNGSSTLVLTLRPTSSGAGISQTASATINTVGSGNIDFDIYNNSGSVTWSAVTVPTSDLVIHYPLDEIVGKSAVDFSSNDGIQSATTTFASPQWQPTGGMIGGALRFSPTAQADVDEAFSYNSAVPITAAYPYTMALWLRTNPGTWYQVCAMLGDATLGSSYSEISVNNSKVNAMVRNTSNSGVSAISPAALADNTWHHVAAVFTSATLRTLYIDGVAIATNTASVPFVANAKRFTIGALMRDVPTQSFSGYVDDVGLWNVALPKEHIAIIHALGRYSHVDLDDPAVAALVEGGLAPETSALAGDYVWAPTTGLSGAVGSTGFQGGLPYLVLNGSGGGLIGTPSEVGNVASYWFDQNGTAVAFGVAGNGIYDWLSAGVWNNSLTGSGPTSAWPVGNDAFFIGAGAGTSYTVRTGAAGTGNITLRNLFLNSDGADPAQPVGSGNVIVGNNGDTGEFRLGADGSVGAASGTLTFNNPINLGLNHSVSFRGGTVRIDGLISGTGTSGVGLASGGGFTDDLAQGTVTLANIANSYSGATTVNERFTLEIAKLANGGTNSSIGASSNTAANLVFSGGTLRYFGVTAATDRNFTLSPDTFSSIEVSAANVILTMSGSSTATSGGLRKTGPGTLVLSGTNLHDGSTLITEGVLSVGASANFGDGSDLVFDGGTLQVTGTTMKDFAGHTTTFTSDKTVGLDIANAANTFTISQSMDMGDGGLSKSGAGTLALTNTNTYSGATFVNGGVLALSHAEALGASSSIIVADNARLNFNQPCVQGPSDPTAFNSPVTLTASGGGATAGAIRFNAPINRSNYSLTNALTINGTGLGTVVSFNAGLNYVNLIGGITGNGGLEIQASGANAAHNHVFTLSGSLDYVGATRFETSAASGRVVLKGTTLPSGTVLSLGAQNNVGTNVIQLDLNGNAQTLAGLQTFVFNSGGTGKNQVINSSTTVATLTINNSGTDFTFGGNLGANGQTPIGGSSGAGNNFGVVKAGGGTLAFTGTNTYTGDTTVQGGILAVTGSSIADTNKLVIVGGKVQPISTEIVNTLFFDAAQQAAGTWGATGSGADHIDDTRFIGTGLLSVTSGAGARFSAWIAGFGIPVENQAPNADPDGDGLNNLLEYVLHGNPSMRDAAAIVPTGRAVGPDYIFTYKRDHLSASDSTQSIEFGSDLNVWGSFRVDTAPGAAPVVIQAGSPDPQSDLVTVTIPTNGAPNFFVRLRVEQ